MKKNNIGVLITIIILLCITVPGAIYGTYMHFKEVALGANKNKEFYYEGKLYFYDGDTLLGTYTCETDLCGYARNSITNQEFESFNQTTSEIEMINNSYAFIGDGEKIILYDVKSSTPIMTYKEVKNYSVGIENDYYLVKNNSGLWGMIKVGNNVNAAIPNNYKYLALNGNMSENNKLSAKRLIAQTENDWKLITEDNSVVVSVKDMIIDYSDYFVVTSDNKIYDFNNNPILGNYQITDVKLINRLAIALFNTGVYYVYDSKTGGVVGTITASNVEEVAFKVENNALVATEGDTVIKTIALN